MFDEFESQIDELATPEFEQEEESMPAMQAEQQAIPQEVVEFIASMYDRNTGTFPRGEEGVKIACEKKFGQQAGQFANYVVEKLSMKGEGAPIATTPGSTDPGGAVDNFKQQMANNTEIKFQRQQQGVEEGSCNMTEAGEMCEVHGMKDCSMKETSVEEGSIHGYSVMKVNEKHNQLKITDWLIKQVGLNKNDPLYFDDADLVWGDKTIVPSALVNPKLKMNDLLTAVVQATGKGKAMQDQGGYYREEMATPQESTELVRIKELMKY
jgi:hypothetical protein